MNNEAIQNYYIHNGIVRSVNDDKGFINASGPLVYEVIRVIDGVALFMEDHIKRMRSSAEIIDQTIQKSDSKIEEEISCLIDKNKTHNMNIKLLCYDLDKKEQNFLIYFIKSSYPDSDIYKKGIHTVLYNCERKNPNAKILNIDFKQKVNAEIKKQGAYEALLVNEQGKITEGSRSNIFFVKGDTVYTALQGEVLLGITRNEIMKVCYERGVKVIESDIEVSDLKEFDGVFMTGTSVNVLPISTIENMEYNSVNNHTILNISKGFQSKIESYVETKKSKINKK